MLKQRILHIYFLQRSPLAAISDAIKLIYAAAQLSMAQHKQTIMLSTCCQSTLGHASKQPYITCADVEVVESSSNRDCYIPFRSETLQLLKPTSRAGQLATNNLSAGSPQPFITLMVACFQQCSGVDPVRVLGSGPSLKFGCEGPQCIGPA
jgi:hypothetical protein